MLRASAEAKNISVNLAATIDSNLDSGVEHGDVLLRFTDAVCGPDNSALGPARTALLECMGSAGLVEAAAIAANFSTNDRAANAIGIPLEGVFLAGSEGYRKELGIDDYPSARNTPDR